ncbi:hypothetical protein O8J54_34885, partial [Pseudomonas aeruginosa]
QVLCPLPCRVTSERSGSHGYARARTGLCGKQKKRPELSPKRLEVFFSVVAAGKRQVGVDELVSPVVGQSPLLGIVEQQDLPLGHSTDGA